VNLSTKFPVNTKTWTTKTISDNGYVAGNGDRLLCDTTSGAFTVNLPAAPTVGDFIVFTDPSNTWITSNLTVGRNGLNINSAAENLICNYAATFTVTYVNVTVGWKIDIHSLVAPTSYDGTGSFVRQSVGGALSVNQTYVGRTEVGVAGETLAFGNPTTMHTDTRYYKAVASAGTGTIGDARRLMTLCASAGSAGGTCIFLLPGGIMRNDAWPAIGAGAQVFVSTTAGSISSSLPGVTDYVARVVGQARYTKELFFNPESSYMTVQA
jgi:hypothetical protein